jgi:hypothetical protein
MKLKKKYINIVSLLLITIVTTACQSLQKVNSNDQYKSKVTVGGNGSLPPSYLSIPGFKQCTQTKNMGSWKSICIPTDKPIICNVQTWKKLQNTNIPSC